MNKNQVGNMIFMFLVLMALMLVIFGCEPQGRKKVKVFKGGYDTEELADDIFWYLLESTDGSYYSTSSPTQLSSFSNVTWTKSSTLPFDQKEVQEDVDVDVDAVDVPEQTQEETTDEAETDADSDSGDSGGDGGGDGGGGE